MKLMSFNIRHDFGQDGPYSFRYRRAAILMMIRQNKPDVICFQEVMPNIAAWLRQNLHDYYVLGCGRDENLEDEQLCIAYRAERFMLCEFRTFWLSASPDKRGSRFVKDQSRCPRACSIIVLKDLFGAQDGTESAEQRARFSGLSGLYRIVNVHLDHMGPEARRLGLQVLLRHLVHNESFPDARQILAGDFNCTLGSEELWGLGPCYFDATEGLGGTFHDFGRQTPEEKIDYIFLNKYLKVRSAVLLKAGKTGIKYYSDHHPLLVDFREKTREERLTDDEKDTYWSNLFTGESDGF